MTAQPARAELIDTGDRWTRAARIEIDAPAERIFDLIADPRQHPRFDGSGSVRASISGPERLALGAHFGMDMRIGFPYRIDNVVVEFEEGRRIAWRHVGRHRWRYELEPVDERRTVVTETFDGSTAIFPPALLLMDAYGRNETAIAKTLVRLKQIAEGGDLPPAADNA